MVLKNTDCLRDVAKRKRSKLLTALGVLCKSLEVYRKRVRDVFFFVDDSCGVDEGLAIFCAAPLIGCNSHNLNLAIE